ncbi:hypothetical protein IV203_033572 [Nitzschia inconspicua]|uniref:Uncharacterized protein n=1 Tax=Nitzschia inconspicua TaxID=303405 RepID=A0A9K3M231_9STRA|nr:hypothetical protein IV203_033572 [Nitzschia inconspicua]
MRPLTSASLYDTTKGETTAIKLQGLPIDAYLCTSHRRTTIKSMEFDLFSRRQEQSVERDDGRPRDSFEAGIGVLFLLVLSCQEVDNFFTENVRRNVILHALPATQENNLFL